MVAVINYFSKYILLTSEKIGIGEGSFLISGVGPFSEKLGLGNGTLFIVGVGPSLEKLGIGDGSLLILGVGVNGEGVQGVQNWPKKTKSSSEKIMWSIPFRVWVTTGTINASIVFQSAYLQICFLRDLSQKKLFEIFYWTNKKLTSSNNPFS